MRIIVPDNSRQKLEHLPAPVWAVVRQNMEAWGGRVGTVTNQIRFVAVRIWAPNRLSNLQLAVSRPHRSGSCFPVIRETPAVVDDPKLRFFYSVGPVSALVGQVLAV